MLFLHKYRHLLNYYRGRTGISFAFVGMSLCYRIRFVDSMSFFEVLPAYSVGHFIGCTIISDLSFFRPASIRCTSHFRLQMVDTRIVFWGTVQPDIVVRNINNVLVANCPAW